MNIQDSFPSQWLKAGDLRGRAVEVTISHVVEEDIGDGTKPVLYFAGKQKGVVLNKTNASVIAEVYGDETESWGGRPLKVYPDKVNFQGKLVDCIRCSVPSPEPEPLREMSGEEEGTELPF